MPTPGGNCLSQCHSTQHGHLSPSTTERHYIHLLDWRLGEERPIARLPALAAIAALSNLTVSNVRVLHHRAADDRAFACEVLHRSIAQRKEWTQPVERLLDLSAFESHRRPVIPANDPALEEIAEFLDLLCVGHSPTAVASMTLAPPAVVYAVDSAAKLVEKQSGYALWYLNGSTRERPPMRPRINPIRDQIERLEQLLQVSNSGRLCLR